MLVSRGTLVHTLFVCHNLRVLCSEIRIRGNCGKGHDEPKVFALHKYTAALVVLKYPALDTISDGLGSYVLLLTYPGSDIH